MEAIKLRDGFCWTGIIDDKLRVFDIVMYTEFGTTYNSYVMKTGDKVVLFETAKARFFDDYLEKLKEVIDVTKIDYLVTSHTEPDHAGRFLIPPSRFVLSAAWAGRTLCRWRMRQMILPITRQTTI